MASGARDEETQNSDNFDNAFATIRQVSTPVTATSGFGV
jgi:hypothetical protein